MGLKRYRSMPHALSAMNGNPFKGKVAVKCGSCGKWHVKRHEGHAVVHVDASLKEGRGYAGIVILHLGTLNHYPDPLVHGDPFAKLEYHTVIERPTPLPIEEAAANLNKAFAELHKNQHEDWLDKPDWRQDRLAFLDGLGKRSGTARNQRRQSKKRGGRV